jgi:hypothetical protein
MAPAHPPIPSVQPRRPGLVGDLLRLGDRIRHSSLLSWPVVLFLEAPRNLLAMPCRRPSVCTGRRPGMRRYRQAGSPRPPGCAGSG